MSILIKENTLEKISSWKDENIHILTDFDRTITTCNTSTSWNVISKANILSEKYIEENKQLYEYYRKIELDETIDYKLKNKFMNEWWYKQIKLLIKYKLREYDLNNIMNDKNIISFREGAKKFLKDMKERGIPVIIISAGIGNIIEQSLIKNGCYFNNIYIISNFFEFKDDLIIGLKNKLITSLNKNESIVSPKIKKQISNRPNIILLGDAISDLKMLKEKDKESALKISFLDENIETNKNTFKSSFDIVCTDNTSFNDLSKKILILRKDNLNDNIN